MFIKIRNLFITGLIVILPIFLTIIIVRFLVLKINNILLDPLVRDFEPYLGGELVVYLAKGIIFLAVVFLVILIGLAARIIVVRRFFSLGENLLVKVPLVNKIYITIKQISNAFLGEGKSVFKRVVLVEYPRKGIYSIGFVTSEVKGEPHLKTGKDVITIFIPTTPNPTSGMLILIPQKEAMPLKMTVAEGMKLVISGGAVLPEAMESKE